MTAQTADRPLLAILLMIAAVTCLSGVDAIGKAALDHLIGVQILLLRSVVILCVMGPAQLRGGRFVLRTTRPWLHAANIAAWLVTMSAFYAAIGHMKLATITAILFTAPLFMTALSVPLLGERVGMHRWAAILVGLVGTLVVVQPGGGEDPVWAALLALLCAFGWALNMVIMRLLTRTESDSTVLIFANGGAVVALLAVVLALGAWRPITPIGATLVVAMAAALLSGQWLQLRAFRLAPIGVVAPFQYFQLVSATLAGWLVWNELPARHVWFGAAIVVASGLYVIWREHRLTRRS
jgi:drug/metabolite transporter (DMT)-like permease